jgi:biopolymer transport protein ExbD
MAGAVLSEGRGARRPLEFDLNMVPMIDLLMVTISFLLITAVWSRSARIEGETSVPSVVGPVTSPTEQRLHVEMADPSKIVLHWDIGKTVIRTSEVSRRSTVTLDHGARTVRFPDLERALADEWRAAGAHRAPGDAAFDELVLHTANDAPYSEIVGAMDAAYGIKRPCGGGKACPAFRVVFAER